MRALERETVNVNDLDIKSANEFSFKLDDMILAKTGT
jgi:hypothetical protein